MKTVLGWIDCSHYPPCHLPGGQRPPGTAPGTGGKVGRMKTSWPAARSFENRLSQDSLDPSGQTSLRNES